MTYLVVIDPVAIEDIQQAVDYYENQQHGLGQRFGSDLDQHLMLLENNPRFRVRYDNVRCLPLAKFPYMIHFTVDHTQHTVTVRAVFHTSIDPENWQERR